MFIDFHCVKCKNGLWIELWIDDGMQFDYWGNKMVKWKIEILFKFCSIQVFQCFECLDLKWIITYAKKFMYSLYDEALHIHRDFYLIDDWWYDEIRLEESFGFVKNLKDGREFWKCKG